MARRWKVVANSAAYALVLACVGCTSEPASVNGTVTYQGQPVSGGSVILYCEDQQIVRGIIGPDGSYSIPNVPRGVCRVTVKTHSPIPPGFSLRQELPPTIEGPIPPHLKLPNHEPAVTIPERYSVPEESGLSLKVSKQQTTYHIVLTN